MNINFSALNSFRNLNLEVQGDKAILVDMDGRYDSIDTYKGPLSAMVRSEGNRFVNNKMRENLMNALADAFGMTDQITTAENGKNQYSATLIDTLERHLGKDFKREDFGFTKDGLVTSGRPLTMRRVTAILNKMENLKFDLTAYEKRLTQAQEKVQSAGPDAPHYSAKSRQLQIAESCLQVLKDDAKGKMLINYHPVRDGYAVRDAFREGDELMEDNSLATLEAHIIRRIGIPINLDRFRPAPSEDGAVVELTASEENVRALNDTAIRQIDALLTEILDRLLQE